MNLDEQIQVLLDEAPQYGVQTAEVGVIAPALKTIAGQLQHSQYYILQTPEQGWVMTQLNHRTQSNVTKNVVYAFPTLNDAAGLNASGDLNVLALPVPVIHILFQILAMKPVDSVVFLETPGNLQSGSEVSRNKLYELIRLSIQQNRVGSNVPPDIA